MTAERFDAIEGARGWLASGVMIVHAAVLSHISVDGDTGDTLVIVFMVMSGFVITHLLLVRDESYGIYIIRRFLRLFPVFAVTCVAGYFSARLVLAALPPTPNYAGLTDYWSCIDHSQTEHLWANVLAHATMLHGTINSSVLPCAAITFNPPAWSLSLEWQFYIIAPFALALATRGRSVGIIGLAAATLLCLAARHGDLGQYQHLSFLPLAVPFFAVGVASRLVYPHLAGRLRRPAAALALLAALLPLGWHVLPLILWGYLFTLLITDHRAVSGIDAAAVRLGSLLFESRGAQFVGKRSYSIYLIHLPILNLVAFFLPLGRLSSGEIFLLLLATGATLTLPLSCASYAVVERPGMALGNRLAARLAARGVPAVVTAP